MPDQLAQRIDDLIRETSSLKVNSQYHSFHTSLNNREQELHDCKGRIGNLRTQDPPVPNEVIRIENRVHEIRGKIENIREKANLPIVLEQLLQKTNILLEKIIDLQQQNLYHDLHAALNAEQNELQGYINKINVFKQQHLPATDEVMGVANKIDAIEETVKDIIEIDLVDRNEQKEMFSNRFKSPPFYLFLHAPEGFGKTKFLLTMKRQLKRQNQCCCLHFDFSRGYLYSSIRVVANHFLRELGNSLYPPGSSPSFEEAGWHIGLSLRQALHTSQPPKRVFILIDSIESFDRTRSKQFFDRFLTEIQRALDHEKISLYTVCAGSYGYLPEKFSRKLKFTPNSLTLLDFSEVREMVASFANQHNLGNDPVFLQNLAAYLMFFTDGQPKCIIDGLEEYRRSPNFFQGGRSFCYNKLKPAIDNLREWIPLQIQELISQFSVLRIYDKVWYTDFLRKLIDKNFFCYNDLSQIEDALQQVQLMSLTANGNSQRDSIFRLFAMMLREENRLQFMRLVERVKDIYEEYLTEMSVTARTHLVVMEALYQELQFAYYQGNQIALMRPDLFDDFFEPQNGILQKYLNILLENTEACRVLSNFKQALQAPDYWEFKFTLNFFLRTDDNYTNAPYQRLLQEVDIFITSNCRGGHHG